MTIEKTNVNEKVRYGRPDGWIKYEFEINWFKLMPNKKPLLRSEDWSSLIQFCNNPINKIIRTINMPVVMKEFSKKKVPL